jgi:hypothetical protein
MCKISLHICKKAGQCGQNYQWKNKIRGRLINGTLIVFVKYVQKAVCSKKLKWSSKMERLLISYALVLLICVWIYPNTDLNINLFEASNPIMNNICSEEEFSGLTEYDLASESSPILNDSQIRTAVTEAGELPKSKYPRMQGAYTLTKMIKKDEVCKMTINENYESVNGEKIKIMAEAEFPAGTLDKDTEITLIIDNKTGAASFFPKVNFNKTAKFSMEVYGTDQGNIGINYYNVDNTMQPSDIRLISSEEEDKSLALNSSDVSGI